MKRINKSIISLVIGFLSANSIQPAIAQETGVHTWQLKRLMYPDKTATAREHYGHIMVYHGITDKEISIALDTQFNRIQSMMFTGTLITDETGLPILDQKTGETLTEEDGCD